MNEGSNIEFYTLIDGNKYDIQGRLELQDEQNVQIPLGFQVLSAGDYTVSISQEYIDQNFDIFLEDTLENTMTNLRQSDYTFNIGQAMEDNNRFVLHYTYNQTLSANDYNMDSSELIAFFSNNSLVSKTNGGLNPKRVSIFDISGREIVKCNYQDTIQTNSLSSGIYIVQYSFEHSRTISKKVIKK